MTRIFISATSLATLWLLITPVVLQAQGTVENAPEEAAAAETEAALPGFDAIMARAEDAPAEALELMRARADTGDAKAAQQMGTFYRQGVGAEVDLAAAKSWYERAVAAGRPYALAPLARTEVALGNGEAAYDLLQRAIAENMPGAERQLGLAHVDRQLGARSDPAQGVAMLMALIDAGDAAAARPLLLRYTWNRLPLPAADRLIAQVEEDGLKGDAPSAEAALLYLTKAERTAPGRPERRAALIAVDGVSPRVLASERMLLAADMHPASFFREADHIIATTPPAYFDRAALMAFRASPNAYVRILQRALREQGYYSGRINGLLSPRTIAAHTRFCHAEGLQAQCREGPLKTATIRAVTAALAQSAPAPLQ